VSRADPVRVLVAGDPCRPASIITSALIGHEVLVEPGAPVTGEILDAAPLVNPRTPKSQEAAS
jgi:hypothetical protein